MVKDYDQIKVLKGLEGIQVRPGMYVGDTSTYEALSNAFWEVISNSFDEHLVGFGNVITVAVDTSTRWYYVEDNGRGIPNGFNYNENKLNLELIFTHIHSGGKFDSESYDFSSGLHGVGVTAVNALSDTLICLSRRRDKSMLVRFVKGKLKSVVNFPGSKNTGTLIMFRPNLKYLPYQDLPENSVIRKLRGLTYVTPKLKIDFTWDGRRGLITSEGLKELFSKKVFGLTQVVAPFEIVHSSHLGKLHCIFGWYFTYKNSNVAYTNGTEQTLGGAHINQLSVEVRKIFHRFCKSILNVNEVKEGFFSVMNVMIKDPQYSSQTKEKLTSSSAKTLIKTSFQESSSIFLQRKLDLKKLEDHLKLLAKRRKEFMSSKVKSTDDSVFGSILPVKLLDCLSRDINENEIFITEGDSAGATAKSARDRLYQAVIPIKGKIINVQRTTVRKALNFECVKNLILALGTGVHSNFTYDKLRYGKIIFMTDADADGYQIRALLIALFYKYLPTLILKGHVYIANPPLFRLKDKKKTFFFIKRNDLENYLIETRLIPADIFKTFKTIFKIFRWDLTSIKVLENLTAGVSTREYPFKVVHHINNAVVKIGEISNTRLQIFRENEISMMKELISWSPSFSPIDKISDVIDLNNKDLIRFKGLGQMNYDELWDLVMDPSVRTMEQVTMTDAKEIHEDFDHIMGKSPLWRKKLIKDSELTIFDLDV